MPNTGCKAVAQSALGRMDNLHNITATVKIIKKNMLKMFIRRIKARDSGPRLSSR